MNHYPALRKLNNSRAMALTVLALCVVISGCMLFSRLMHYVAADDCQYIPLTQSNGITRVMENSRDTARLAPNTKLLMSPALLSSPSFRVTDDNTVWSGETQVEIFRVSYDNASGEVVVQSKGGDKVLAPGTSNTYEFALENTGNVALDYTMSMEAYFSHNEYPIPVQVRVTDYQKNLLTGSETAMADVMALNNVKQSGVIAAGKVYPYTLEWEWPFEGGDDAYDTLLGNLANEEDITLTIVINTTATCNIDPNANGGVPKTGDTSNIGMLTATLVLSLSGFAMVVLLLRRKGEQDEQA